MSSGSYPPDTQEAWSNRRPSPTCQREEQEDGVLPSKGVSVKNLLDAWQTEYVADLTENPKFDVGYSNSNSEMILSENISKDIWSSQTLSHFHGCNLSCPDSMPSPQEVAEMPISNTAQKRKREWPERVPTREEIGSLSPKERALTYSRTYFSSWQKSPHRSPMLYTPRALCLTGLPWPRWDRA